MPKVTVNLPEQTVDILRNIANARNTTVTEALKQVIETQDFFNNEIQKGKDVLLQNNADKSVQRVVFPRTANKS